jgi:hypothetical protein
MESNLKSLIGKEANGFIFEDTQNLRYNRKMKKYNGEVGKIIEYDEDEDSYRLLFDDGEFWNYPASDISKYLNLK